MAKYTGLVRSGLLFSAACVIVASCASAGAPRALAQQSSPRDLVIRAIRDLLPSGRQRSDFEGTEVWFQADSSSVVSGLVYHWGQYRASGSHGFVAALAGERGQTTRLIENPGDWAYLAQGWRPGAARDAICACGELIAAAGPGRFPHAGILYTDSIMLQDPALIGLETLSMNERARLVLPTVSQEQSGATVLTWVFQRGRSRRFRCEFDFAGTLQARLTVVDSITKLRSFSPFR